MIFIYFCDQSRHAGGLHSPECRPTSRVTVSSVSMHVYEIKVTETRKDFQSVNLPECKCLFRSKKEYFARLDLPLNRTNVLKMSVEGKEMGRIGSWWKCVDWLRWYAGPIERILLKIWWMRTMKMKEGNEKRQLWRTTKLQWETETGGVVPGRNLQWLVLSCLPVQSGTI